MKTYSVCTFSLGLLLAIGSPAAAQCDPCATQVVAYQPVVAQPTVTFEEYRGWYPGKLLDRWRLRRAGYSGPTALTANFAPTATTQTVGFAPMSTSRPHVTAFAPLSRTTTARQVLMRPVVAASPVITTSATQSVACDPCAACPTGASTFSTPSTDTNGSQTPQPYLSPEEAAPLRSQYPPENGSQSNGSSNRVNGSGNRNTGTRDPGPATNNQNQEDASTYLEPPQLYNPSPKDRTARRGASVEVWNAVYHKPVTTSSVSETSDSRTQAEIDADGWTSVPSN